jgi:acylphosphatase
MKKITMLAAIAVFSAGTAFAQDKLPAPAAGHGHRMTMNMKGGKCAGMCPAKLKGVTVVSKDVDGGVEIVISAKDKATAARVQKLAAAMQEPKAVKCPRCPAAVPGADAKVENTPDGVKVTVTGKTPEAVKKIQEAAAKMHAKTGPTDKVSKKYFCPMDGYQSDKPGKCPKCGMTLKERK